MQSLADLLLGKRIPSGCGGEEGASVGPAVAVPILGLDALASAAYGPEALLTVLIPLGVRGLRYVLPLSIGIVVLLSLLNLSYRQTIQAYPQGGGSYTVARENLSRGASLVAASALLLDYLLNVAVAISAGVGAVVSAIPGLLPYTLPLCLAVLALLTILNLRGFRSTGLAFLLPTYSFCLAVGVILLLGAARSFSHGGHPSPVVAPPAPPIATIAAPSLWMLARAFGNGCTAMTGVEAVSNAVPLFRKPSRKGAGRTLTVIITMLGVMLLGIATLCGRYDVMATPPAAKGYESVLSQLAHATLGSGFAYGWAMASIFAVLALSANTSFADFPRVCRLIALDGYLPEAFALRGRRLVFSHGIVVLSLISALLLVVFGGVTDRLIPLFAIGALLAFTTSQVGMVQHWRKRGGKHAKVSLALNAAGAAGTGLALIIVLASKFTEGAWVSALLVVLFVVAFTRVHTHYQLVTKQTASNRPIPIHAPPPAIAVVPVKRWSSLVCKCLEIAMTLTGEVVVVHVRGSDPAPSERFVEQWSRLVERPARQAGRAVPRLVCLESPYRELVPPLVRFVKDLAREHPGRVVAVVMPRLIEPRWRYYLLHNVTPTLLRTFILFRGGPRIVLIDVPWYLSDR
jgi:amino acid transporter